MDAGTAQKYGFSAGQQVRILTTGPTQTFAITGIAEFGTANNLAGATLAAFTLPTVQAIAQETGKLDDINVVTASGADKSAVQQAIAKVLPSGVEVVTGQTVVNESTSSVNQALGFFSTALLVFAFISLFVGAFTIFNTFSIIVGQRTRELALLRIVGANRRQVFRSVLGEAAITGLVSSVIGLGLGVLAALGLEAVPARFALTGPATLRVGGIYQANSLIGSYLVSSAFFLSHYTARPPGALLLRTNGSSAVDNAVTKALAPFPNVQVQTRAQFEQAQVSAVNQVLGLVYALLALAVLIALIGIVNTLMLSVFERTREIGLLRAVGMRRRQVRTMIRSEAVILAIFGAIVAIIIGTGMGIALVSSLKNQGITDTVVPYSSLVIFLILAALLGLVAASWPARRAAKLDVLAAIAAQ